MAEAASALGTTGAGQGELRAELAAVDEMLALAYSDMLSCRTRAFIGWWNGSKRTCFPGSTVGTEASHHFHGVRRHEALARAATPRSARRDGPRRRPDRRVHRCDRVQTAARRSSGRSMPTRTTKLLGSSSAPMPLERVSIFKPIARTSFISICRGIPQG